MKRFLVLCLILTLVLAVTGCSNTAENDESVTFKATIIEIVDGYFLVEPIEGSPQADYAERIMVAMKHMEPSPEPLVGDIIEITYNGIMTEEDPPVVAGVQYIKVVA